MMRATNKPIDEDVRLIWRRALYCGVGTLIALVAGLMLDALFFYPFHDLDLRIWRVDLLGIILSSLSVGAVCVGTVLALRRYWLITPSIVVSFLIGLLSHKVAKEFLWALYPTDDVVGLGRLGRFIDQHYSMVFGFDAGALLGGFVAAVLIAFFCAALSGNMRAFLGGMAAGLIMALGTLLWSFWFGEAKFFSSKSEMLIALAFTLPQIFVAGAIQGGGIALGEYLAVRSAGRRRQAETSLNGD